jgi:hypothetical protein
MTILRTSAKELVIHNPIRLDDPAYAQLETLGFVGHIVAPNTFHGSDAPFYRKRFPLARFHPPGSGAQWPTSLRKDVDALPLNGLRFSKETVFFHRVSKTLVVTDLVFNMQIKLRGFEKNVYEMNKIYQRFGPSRIFRYGFIADKVAFGRSLDKILRWDFERVIMNHGTILERDGPAMLLKSFGEMGIKPLL